MIHLKKINISIFEAMCFILITGFIKSPYLERYRFFNLLYIIIKLICLIFLIMNHKKLVVNNLLITIILYEVVLCVSTIKSGVGIQNVLVNGISTIIFCLFINYVLSVNSSLCVRVLYNVCELLVWINVLTLLLFPNGLYLPNGLDIDIFDAEKKRYFLGHQNQMIIYSLPAITLGKIRKEIDTSFSEYRVFFLEIISLFFVIRVWSAVSIVGLSLFFILTLYNRISKTGFRVSVLASGIINIVFFMLFVIQQNFHLFDYIIVNLLNRNLTLTGRTQIWYIAFEAFLQNPILGWGNGKGREVFGFANAHNRYLNTLFTSGIIGMFFFIMMILLVNKSLQDFDNNIVRIFCIFFFTLFVMFQGEVFGSYLVYAMIVIAYNVNKLNSEIFKNSTIHLRQTGLERNLH